MHQGVACVGRDEAGLDRHVGEPADDLFEGDPDLEAGQVDAQTHVGPDAEGQLRIGIAVDAQLVEAAHIYRLPRLARLRYLWLPATTPFLLSGTRLGFSLAWKVVVLVEIFGLSSGVGYRLNSAFSAQNVADVLAWTIAFALMMAVIEYGLLQLIERRLTRWKRVARV